jgi:hypothetical protein
MLEELANNLDQTGHQLLEWQQRADRAGMCYHTSIACHATLISTDVSIKAGSCLNSRLVSVLALAERDLREAHRLAGVDSFAPHVTASHSWGT